MVDDRNDEDSLRKFLYKFGGGIVIGVALVLLIAVASFAPASSERNAGEIEVWR